MNDRNMSTRPRKVVGLPDLEICQGSEPKIPKLTINLETARQMKQQEMEEEIKWEREQAARAAEPRQYKGSRWRSRSKRKRN